MNFLKSIGLCLIIVFSASDLNAQVEFHQGDFASLLAKAKELNKPILIDAFTDWCGPCKMLDKEVFQDEKAAAMINKNFIAYKLDMEKGEGPTVAMKFRVNAYPSTLFLSADGFLLTKKIGFPQKDGYLKWCKAVASNKFPPFTNLQAANLTLEYPEFFKTSFTSDQWKRTRPKLEQINEYLENQSDEDLFNEVNWGVISVLSRYSHNRLNWVLKNKSQLEKLYPQSEIDRVMQKLISVKADSISKLKMEDGDKVLLAEMDKMGIKDKDMRNNSMFSFYSRSQLWSKLIDHAYKTAPDGQPSPGTMNSICWNIYEKSDDPKVLKKAITAMENAVDIDDNPYYIDTLAHLYFKTKQMDKARKSAAEAMKKGKLREMNMKETEKLLDQLK